MILDSGWILLIMAGIFLGLGYLGVPERRAVGALMARHFAGMEKVAIVVQAQKITDVVQGEAQHKGLNLRLFPEHAEAVAWAIS